MKQTFLLLLLATAFQSFAQYSSTAKTNIVFENKPRGFLTSLPPPPKGQEGSYYVDDNWQKATIYLKDSTKLETVMIRLDVKDNVVEIQHEDQIKVLPGNKVLALTVQKVGGGVEQYINGQNVPGLDNYYKNRLLQVLYEGEVMLLCKMHTEIIRAANSQNPMLATVQKDDRIVLKKNYVIVKDENLVDAEGSKSEFRDEMISMFGADVEPLLKKVNSRKELDLIFLVKELNERFKS